MYQPVFEICSLTLKLCVGVWVIVNHGRSKQVMIGQAHNFIHFLYDDKVQRCVCTVHVKPFSTWVTWLSTKPQQGRLVLCKVITDSWPDRLGLKHWPHPHLVQNIGQAIAWPAWLLAPAMPEREEEGERERGKGAEGNTLLDLACRSNYLPSCTHFCSNRLTWSW